MVATATTVTVEVDAVAVEAAQRLRQIARAIDAAVTSQHSETMRSFTTEPLGDPGAPAAQRRDLAQDTAAGSARVWGLEVGYVAEEGPGFVKVRASRDGTPCTLKLFAPGAGYTAEHGVLQAARGRGYPLLREADGEHRALLLESVGESLRSRPVDTESADGILATVLEQAWTAPIESGVDSSTTVAERMAQEIECLAARHDPGGIIVGRALTYARHRAAEGEPRLVVLHGRPTASSIRAVHHPREGAERGYVLVDPLGLRGEPEYDLGYWLASDNRFVLSSQDPLVALRGRCARLAGVTGTDAEAAWQWTMVHRVHRGLTKVAGGDGQAGRLYLAAARALTDGQLR